MKVENLGRESCRIYELGFTICFIADLRFILWPCDFRLGLSKQYHGSATSTIDSVRAWIGWNEESWHAGGPIYNFAIVGEDGKLAGMVEANTDTENMTGLRPGDANVSYNIYPAARGKGHATRAVNLMEHYLAGMGIQRSVLRIDPDNETSLGVPTRLGYHEHDRIPTPDGTTLRMFIKEL